MDIKSLLFSFKGRIGRGPYWAVMVALIVIEIIIMTVSSALSNGNGGGFLGLIFGLVTFVVALACIWVVLAVQVKRWHDRNKSGWWALIGLVPFIGGIWVLVECGCLPAVNEGNRFGA
jgi:uncharacterized membrane protein YhaH (DUF805 family)